jgi:hypothetical protein
MSARYAAALLLLLLLLLVRQLLLLMLPWQRLLHWLQSSTSLDPLLRNRLQQQPPSSSKPHRSSRC